MDTLAIDIETYSSNDIKSGVYKYTEAKDFTILLMAYSLNGAPVEIIDFRDFNDYPFLESACILDTVLKRLLDPSILKTAHNASFERTCLSKYFNAFLSPDQWECTMTKAAMAGLPLSLDAVAKALDLENQKDAAGKALIKYFCIPCKPTKVNGERTRNLPEHAPEKWEAFKNYCIQDVIVEQSIRRKIDFFHIPTTEVKLYNLDQKINDRGVLMDRKLISNAIKMDIAYREKLTAEAVELTGLNNTNSPAQLKTWLSSAMDSEVKGLTKNDIPELLKNTDCKIVTRVLEIRQEMSKTSVKKYIAMAKAICEDGRLRGILQFYGAGRTGRWAGRIVQPQNLPRIKMKHGDLDLARQIVRSGDLELLELLFGNVPDTLSQLIRTAFIAGEGKVLPVSDFKAIEARVIAWLSREKWRLDVFATHGRIYEASAAQMFKVPLDSISYEKDGKTVKGANYELRAQGKIAELALGFGGGPNALIVMDTDKKLKADELPKLVRMWRNANPGVVNLWNTIEDAAITALTNPGEKVVIDHNINFQFTHNTLFIQLPSGRKLSYIGAHIRNNRFGGEGICYMGLDQTNKQWSKIETYGGKLTENIVQAIARDLLAEALLRLDENGCSIVMHVHDEAVLEELKNSITLEELNNIMSICPDWAKGLPLGADGYETHYYKKD